MVDGGAEGRVDAVDVADERPEVIGDCLGRTVVRFEDRVYN